jgi:hypothetical protein
MLISYRSKHLIQWQEHSPVVPVIHHEIPYISGSVIEHHIANAAELLDSFAVQFGSADVVDILFETILI